MKAWAIRACFIGLVLSVLPAFAGQPGGPLAPIALFAEFQQDPPKAVKAALQDELSLIMTPMSLRFDWRDLHGPRDREPAVELAVISFKGRCDVAGLVPHANSTGPLGWTHISDGEILPFSDVDCDGVRSFLQRTLLSLPATAREEAFGRALARVLAHELYHIFADTLHHGSCGVGKEAYTVHDLLTTDFRFENNESKALKNSKAYESLEKGVELRY